MDEALRCMQCPEPQACTLNCPAGNDIPEALWLISEGRFVEAAQIFAATSPLPRGVRACLPQSLPGRLRARARVRALRRSASWRRSSPTWPAKRARCALPCRRRRAANRIAVVGSGPAGITVAEDLIRLGHEVTVYEAWPEPGGVLVYGIPSFKLEKHVVMRKIRDLEEAGVTFVTNTRVGEAIHARRPAGRIRRRLPGHRRRGGSAYGDSRRRSEGDLHVDRFPGTG
jgi:glutamate synthase (NADPH) small chain